MMLRLGFGRKTLDRTERTLDGSASGALVLIYGVSSGDCTTMEGDEVEGLLVSPSGIPCCYLVRLIYFVL